MVPEEDGATRQAAKLNAQGILDNTVSGSHHAKSVETKNGYHILTENYNPVREILEFAC